MDGSNTSGAWAMKAPLATFQPRTLLKGDHVMLIGDLAARLSWTGSHFLLLLVPSPDEVAECFTVPLGSFLERDRWVHREGFAPIFTGGPHPTWGLMPAKRCALAAATRRLTTLIFPVGVYLKSYGGVGPD